ncbi:MAG: glycosyltransferase family 4 protein [Halobacteriota archaeon]
MAEVRAECGKPVVHDGVHGNAGRTGMRILLVQDTDWIARNAHQQHHVAERLTLRGHDISVIDYDLLWQSTDAGGLLSKRQVFHNVSKIVSDVNITVTRPRILRVPILDYVSMLVTYRREIATQLREFRPDVVIGMYLLTNYLALRASRRAGTPLVVLILEPNYEMIPWPALRPIGKIIEQRTLKEAHSVIVINGALRDYAIRMGARPETTHVIRAGIDTEHFGRNVDGSTVRQRYGLGERDTVLFFMGWLYHFSGLHEVLTEMAKLKRDDLGVKLLIVGDGDALQDLQCEREELGLEDYVAFAGKQPYKKIPEFIAASDICLLPAHDNAIMHDIVPIKMYEYMAMGKPVIATRLHGLLREFGDGNGVLWIDRPEDSLRKAMELVNEGSVEAHGEAARHFVRNNDWTAVVDDFEQVLNECIGSKRGSPNNAQSVVDVSHPLKDQHSGKSGQ